MTAGEPPRDERPHREQSGDERQLAELGYRQELPRILRLWTNWAVGFAFISPIVGLYTIVALGATTAGSPWVWSLPVVIGGQFLVALVYARLSSKWPIAGGIYQWSRRLQGPRFGWWAGWTYMWALVVVLSTTAYAGGGFLGQLVGITHETTVTHLTLALIVMAAFTSVNAIGLGVLRYTVNVGIACEIVASVGIGLALILVFRRQPFSVLVHVPRLPQPGPYAPAFLGAIAYTGWAILGFDACGGLSEETKDASRQVPRATLLSIVTVGAVMIISALGLTLATRDPAAVAAGRVSDPVSSAVVGALGGWSERPFLAVVVIGFVACGIAEQATLVRVLYSFSRDGMLPLSRMWGKVSKRNDSPTYAVLLSGALASLAFLYTKVLAVLVNFATGAYYLGFLFPIVAVIVEWVRHRRSDVLDTRTRVIAAAALVWLVFEFVNIAWPRQSHLPWYENWAVVVGSGSLGLVGLGYFVLRRPYLNFRVTAGGSSKVGAAGLATPGVSVVVGAGLTASGANDVAETNGQPLGE
jgi:amino acid transporter